MADRDFDLVLFGATGFTGRLTAEYLAAHAPEGFRWALAGRSRAKLEGVRAELASAASRVADLPLEVVDASDAAGLEALARRTRVVCTTVGPYAKHGLPLVGACAVAGTDYCDITGETHFIRASIDAHHATAERTGARIVHCCGFDSIPSDLGTLMLVEHARRTADRALAEVRFFAGETKGGVSGGTIASMLGIVDEMKRDPGLRRVLGDPYALSPDRAHDLDLDRGDAMGVGRDRDLGQFTGPFVMAEINTRVVRRSNALLGHAYGKGFRYAERMSFGKGPAGLARAVGFAGGMIGFLAAASVPVARPLLARALPAPGEGPSAEARRAGFFVCRLLATLEGDERPSLLGIVKGTSDPGYGETAKMLGESALALALDQGPARRGGVLTPATALGATLTERLRRAGMTFDVRPFP